MNVLLEEIQSIISKDQKFKIVFYGDSTTSTEWVHPNWRGIIEYVIKMELENFDKTQGSPTWLIFWTPIND